MEKNFASHPFKLYAYKASNQIISIVLENGSYEEYSKYQVKRESPDKILINYNFSGKEKILFKESFHPSWESTDSKTNKKIDITKTEEGFMELIPEENINKLFIFQVKTKIQKIGILLSLIGIFLCL